TQWLADALATYLGEYGHRSAGELEFMQPRWADDPAPLLQTFRGYVLDPGQTSADDLVQRQLRRRLELQRAIDQRLTAHWWERLFPVRRALVRYYTRWAQRYAPLRENPKFYLLAVALEQRRVLLALAARLAQRGQLHDPTDVFFLFKEELATLVDHADEPLMTARLRNRARRRRAQYDIYAAHTPPPVLGAPPLAIPAAAAPKEEMRMLTGLAASQGVAEGLARVAATPEQGRELQTGEILVAKFTDPGWTPLFPLAAAVVTEIGGMLSHGAIVAREYGIPAVVNVRRATERIRTGQRIRVDGNRGTVDLLPDDA
ncbi:MAG: PEP-utilizing enzyme, partial [Dehalococcoidia bacterium]